MSKKASWQHCNNTLFWHLYIEEGSFSYQEHSFILVSPFHSQILAMEKPSVFRVLFQRGNLESEEGENRGGEKWEGKSFRPEEEEEEEEIAAEGKRRRVENFPVSPPPSSLHFSNGYQRLDFLSDLFLCLTHIGSFRNSTKVSLWNDIHILPWSLVLLIGSIPCELFGMCPDPCFSSFFFSAQPFYRWRRRRREERGKRSKTEIKSASFLLLLQPKKTQEKWPSPPSLFCKSVGQSGGGGVFSLLFPPVWSCSNWVFG